MNLWDPLQFNELSDFLRWLLILSSISSNYSLDKCPGAISLFVVSKSQHYYYHHHHHRHIVNYDRHFANRAVEKIRMKSESFIYFRNIIDPLNVTASNLVFISDIRVYVNRKCDAIAIVLLLILAFFSSL